MRDWADRAWRAAEVDQHGLVAVAHDDVGGLDVAMQDAFGMDDGDGASSSVRAMASTSA
ncbi:MAG: hypothetical protein R3D67_22340 [Hyphomicrobiaceae bacterium]